MADKKAEASSTAGSALEKDSSGGGSVKASSELEGGGSTVATAAGPLAQHEVASVEGMASSTEAVIQAQKAAKHSYRPQDEVDTTDTPPAKRLKPNSEALAPAPAATATAATEQKLDTETPDIATEVSDLRAPVPTEVKHASSSASLASSSSEYSSVSSAAQQQQRYGGSTSPVPTPAYAAEVPPAPPSTPASQPSAFSWDMASATPLPALPVLKGGVQNAALLEQQQLLAEGAETPAPTKPPAQESGDAQDDGKPSSSANFPEDFSDWAVGDRYELVRMLGRGSYGEVAQAIDLHAGRRDAFVAIKRIQSPFDQEVDAIRLYREIHILRRIRGHECIIQLLDIVQPPTDDIDDFHDLYLVFECKFIVACACLHTLSTFPFVISLRYRSHGLC